jgi:hypothetical protein
MYIKDEITFQLLKKTLDEAHKDCKSLDLELEGNCLKQKCYCQPANLVYYRYFEMPFNVADLKNEKFTVHDDDLKIIACSLKKETEEQVAAQKVEVNPIFNQKSKPSFPLITEPPSDYHYTEITPMTHNRQKSYYEPQKPQKVKQIGNLDFKATLAIILAIAAIILFMCDLSKHLY